jgi:DNA-binding response OmpR family regulator
MTRLLLIDDDRTLAMLLRSVLLEHGYELDWADRPSTGLAKLDTRPDLLLLDIMLPEQNGFDICQRLRAAGNGIPIIMLTARGEDNDRIKGLKLGADDYLAKPFNHLELIARIEAVLRRQGRWRANPSDTNNRLDHARRTLWLAGNEHILTATEFRLLETLTAAPGRVFSRQELMEALDEAGAIEAFDRAIDSHISRLRSRIEADARNPQHLHTVRGMGYRFTW